MNLLHRRYCRSDGWRRAVHLGMMPWVLRDVDLGANVLEIGPGPGVTTDWLRERVPALPCVPIEPRGFGKRLAAAGFGDIEIEMRPEYNTLKFCGRKA